MVEFLGHQRLRQRGPALKLADSKVLTMEIVGEYLPLPQDKAILETLSPLPSRPRTTPPHHLRPAGSPSVPSQGALWQRLLPQTGCEPWLQRVDSFPLPICQFARAHRCRCFGGKAAFGRQSIVVGDCNHWSPTPQEMLAPQGLQLQTPFKKARQDPWPRHSAILSRFRYRIDTVLRSTRGPLPHQACPGERPVASGPSLAQKSAQPHPRVPAESGSGPPSPTTLEAWLPELKPAHGVKYDRQRQRSPAAAGCKNAPISRIRDLR